MACVHHRKINRSGAQVIAASVGLARDVLINSHVARLRAPYLLKMGSASRQFSKPLAVRPTGKKTNAQAARHAWKICTQTPRERLFWAICCVVVLAKRITIACGLRLAVGRYGGVKVSSSAQRVSPKRLARATCQLIRTSLVWCLTNTLK
jgi:hypothetical protein